MRVRDIMTRDVVTVPPETPVSALVQLISDRSISSVPVIGADGRLMGIVTEADLLFRLSARLKHKGGWLAGMVTRPSEQAAEYARAHGRTAADIMTTELVTTAETTSVDEVAKIMQERRIKRLPVVRGEHLVGVVSRIDLLRAVLAPPGTLDADAPDSRVRARVMAAMREQPWADTLFTWPEVVDGVVTFYGFCHSPEVERGLRVLAEGVPGVKRVEMKVDEAPPIPFALG